LICNNTTQEHNKKDDVLRCTK